MVVLAGGNNGGMVSPLPGIIFDGVQAEVILLAQQDRITGDAGINLISQKPAY